MSRRSWLRLSPTVGALAAGPSLISTILGEGGLNPEAPVRLNSNENQHGPSPKVMQAILAECQKSNYYTWTGRKALRSKIAATEGVSEDQILLGAGSTELLQLTGIAFASSHEKFISCYPTFPILMNQGEKFKASWTKVPLDKSHSHPLPSLLQAAGNDPAFIYICNPNNPTGSFTPFEQLREFTERLSPDQYLFIDEAYLEFTSIPGNKSASELVAKMPNIIVSRTFSKIHGLAGLRVGYVIAQPNTIAKIQQYQVGFGIDIPRISLVAASAALDDVSFVAACKIAHQKEKDRICRAFDEWQVDYTPSQTSFIYFSTARFQASLVKKLKARNILIRDYMDQPGFARVSVGKGDQNSLFLDACQNLLIS